MPNITQLLI